VGLTVGVYVNGQQTGVGGGGSSASSYPKFIIVNANYTVTDSDLVGYLSTFLAVDATAGPITVTLPAANARLAGEWTIHVTDMKDQAALNNITIVPAGTDTINLATSQVLTANGESITIINDGVSNWQVY